MAVIRDQIKIIGDTAEALPYVAHAKGYAANLRRQANPPKFHTYMPNADVLVRIDLDPHQNRILIMLKSCSVADSGVYSEQLPYLSPTTGAWVFPDAATAQWAVEYQKDAEGNYVVDGSGLRTVIKSGLVDFHNKKQPLSHNASFIGSGYNGKEKDAFESFVIDELTFLDKYKASKFSGTMRKVVQVLLGLGFKTLKERKLADGSAGGQSFVFDFSAINTMGIFISNKTKEWWVIRITNTHVYRRKAKWCPVYVKGRDDVKIFDRFLDTDWVPLTNGSSITTKFYNKYRTMFYGCGWAFHPDGHTATNVGTEFVRLGSTNDEYFRTHRVHVIISEDAETGAPSSVSVIEKENGIIWNDDEVKNGKGHVHFPDETDKTCYTFDYNRECGTPTEDISAGGPLYSYFDDNGDEFVLRTKRPKTGGGGADSGSITLVQIKYYSFLWDNDTSGDNYQTFGTRDAPRSPFSGPVSWSYSTVPTVASDDITSTTYTPPTRLASSGGGSDSRYFEYANLGIAYAEMWLGGLYSGRRFRNGNPEDPEDYCYWPPGDPTFTDKYAPVVNHADQLLVRRTTSTYSATYTKTDAFAAVPYGERQAVFLGSQIFDSSSTVDETNTPYLGKRYVKRVKTLLYWATSKACVNQYGSTALFNPDVSGAHNGRIDFGVWAWSIDLYHYSAQIDSAAWHPVSDADWGRILNMDAVSINPFTSGNAVLYDEGAAYIKSDQYADGSRSSWVDAQKLYNYTQAAAAMPPDRTYTVAAQYTYSTRLCAPDGSVKTLKNEDYWGPMLFRAYDANNGGLRVYASFDAFDPGAKHMYSRLPFTSATVTYPGVASFTAKGVFGFVGYEDTSDGN